MRWWGSASLFEDPLLLWEADLAIDGLKFNGALHVLVFNGGDTRVMDTNG
jgi:hypothetical protein